MKAKNTHTDRQTHKLMMINKRRKKENGIRNKNQKRKTYIKVNITQ